MKMKNDYQFIIDKSLFGDIIFIKIKKIIH